LRIRGLEASLDSVGDGRVGPSFRHSTLVGYTKKTEFPAFFDSIKSASNGDQCLETLKLILIIIIPFERRGCQRVPIGHSRERRERGKVRWCRTAPSGVNASLFVEHMSLRDVLLLVSHPHGLPQPGDFKKVTEEMGELEDGKIRVQTQYLSVDPSLRGENALSQGTRSHQGIKGGCPARRTLTSFPLLWASLSPP
jgi:hypothetical protein